MSSTSARHLLFDLGRKITESTGEAREMSCLFQRCSVLVQRFNAILLHDSLPAQDCTDRMIVLYFVFPSIFKVLGIIFTEGKKSNDNMDNNN